jgi:hypothetical protein
MRFIMSVLGILLLAGCAGPLRNPPDSQEIADLAYMATYDSLLEALLTRPVAPEVVVQLGEAFKEVAARLIASPTERSLDSILAEYLKSLPPDSPKAALAQGIIPPLLAEIHLRARDLIREFPSDSRPAVIRKTDLAALRGGEAACELFVQHRTREPDSRGELTI